MPIPVAFDYETLRWSERADGAWHAEHLGHLYEVTPQRDGGFRVWEHRGKDWHYLGQRSTLGGGMQLAAKHANAGQQAVEGHCEHTHPPEVPSAPCPPVGVAGENVPVIYEAGLLDAMKASAQEKAGKIGRWEGHTQKQWEKKEEASQRKALLAHRAMNAAVTANKPLEAIRHQADIQRHEAEAKFYHEQAQRAWKVGVWGHHDAPGTAPPEILTKTEVNRMDAALRPRAVEAQEDAGGLAVVERDVPAIRRGRKKGQLKTAKDIYDLVHPTLVTQTQEVFVVIPMDIHGRPLNDKPYEVARGQRDRVSVDPSDVLRPVVQTNAKGFVMVHNHPSGQGKASPADVDLTRRIHKSAKELDVVMIDHVVCGDGQYESIREAYGKKAGFAR